MAAQRDERLSYTRRRLINTFGAAAGVMIAAPLVSSRAFAQVAFSDNPFKLGVASGDPAPDGFVIWTRLAPKPFEIGFGMPSSRVEVDWEVASDEAFGAIVQSGKAVASPHLAHAVHVEVAGLNPARPYWYRFRAGGVQSPAGRAKTAPARARRSRVQRFGVAGCQSYEAGLFTAHKHLAAEDLDFVFCYGDYIYENAGTADAGGRAARHPEHAFRRRDLQRRRLPAPLCPVQDGSRPAGGARGARMVCGVGRPRDRQQLGLDLGRRQQSRSSCSLSAGRRRRRPITSTCRCA